MDLLNYKRLQCVKKETSAEPVFNNCSAAVIGCKNAFVQDSFWAIALFCVRISLVSSQPCGVGNVGYCQATKLAKSSKVQSIQIYMPPYTTHGK